MFVRKRWGTCKNSEAWYKSCRGRCTVKSWTPVHMHETKAQEI